MCLANALVMLMFTFIWLGLPYTFGDEAFLIKWTSLAKKELFKFDSKPDPLNWLFVDVSANKTIVPNLNEFGEWSTYSRSVITDRQHLAEFFELLNLYKQDIPLVICDILMDVPSSQDSSLAVQIDSLGDKLLGVSHIDATGQIYEPVFDMPYVVSTYTSTQGLFLKYPIAIKEHKTLPVAMLEKLDHAKYIPRKWFFSSLKGRLSLPNPIIDFKVRKADFAVGGLEETPNFTAFKMGTILDLRKDSILTFEEMGHYFKNKAIIIGDYVNDTHLTPFGKISGPLVLYNAYLTLKNEEHAISLGWVLLLLGGYFWLTYRVLTQTKVSGPAWLFQLFKSRLGKLILNSLDELTLLILITILSYFLFQKHINILFLLIYIKTFEFFLLRWNKSKVEVEEAPMPHNDQKDLNSTKEEKNPPGLETTNP